MMPKGNLKPVQTREFLERQKPKYGDNPLGAPISIRFQGDVDAALRAMGDRRQEYIREAVRAALQRDGLI